MGRLALLAAAATCLVLAAVGAYGRYAVLDEHNFADRAASTLGSDELREELATRIARGAIGDRPGLTVAATGVEAEMADNLAERPGFEAAFRSAAAGWHHTLFSDADARAPFVVAGSGQLLREEIEDRTGRRVEPIPDPSLMAVGGDTREHALRTLAPIARAAALPVTFALALAGLVLLALGAARAESRRRAVAACALAVAAAAGVLGAGVTGARDVVLAHFDTGFGDAVVSQIWSAYLGDLRVWSLAVCAAGLIVAAAAADGSRPDWRALAASPATTGGRLGRAAGLLVVAAIAIAAPDLALHLVLVALAAACVYVAAGDVVRVLARRPRPAAARARAGGTSRADSSTPSPRSPARPRRTW